MESKSIVNKIKINFNNTNVNNEFSTYDSENKQLTINTEKQTKYTVYLCEHDKENEAYHELMTESELNDLKHMISFGLTETRIQKIEKFIE